MKGKIKIRLGNENQQPSVVYVSGFNRNIDLWVCEILNTGDTVYSTEESLIDFDYKKFRIMYYEWKIQRQDQVKENYVKLLAEYKKTHSKK